MKLTKFMFPYPVLGLEGAFKDVCRAESSMTFETEPESFCFNIEFEIDDLTILSMIPMACLLGASAVVGKYMMKKWDERQAVFSKLSDFSQESFSGIAVIKAFVKEAKELWAFKKLNKEI